MMVGRPDCTEAQPTNIWHFRGATTNEAGQKKAPHSLHQKKLQHFREVLIDRTCTTAAVTSRANSCEQKSVTRPEKRLQKKRYKNT